MATVRDAAQDLAIKSDYVRKQAAEILFEILFGRCAAARRSEQTPQTLQSCSNQPSLTISLAEASCRMKPSIGSNSPFDLTMDTNDAIEAAHAFPNATIVPVHYEGWAHFTQGRDELEAAFAALGLTSRLRVLDPGVATEID